MTGNEKFRLKVVDDLRKNRVIVESDEDYITLLKKANKDLSDLVREREKQLAAAQLQIKQLREALSDAKPLVQDWCNENGGAGAAVFAAVRVALAQPTDTTALEVMIAKAGEVMRKRCAMQFAVFKWRDTAKELISALPGVKLEDLK